MTGDRDTLQFTYMDQGHILQVKDAAAAVQYRYYYDAAGKRRIKAMGDETLGIDDNVSYSFYEGEDLICQQDQGNQIQPDEAYTPKFLLLDHLGSTRAEMSFNENGTASIGQLTDLMPYGEEINPPLLESEAVKFTGKQRDAESGLDFFGARFYGNLIGRWISPDEVFAANQIENPQSWNLFSYVNGDPINKFDSNGQFASYVHKEITKEAISELKLVNPLNFLWYDRVVEHTENTDFINSDDPRQHFDNMKNQKQIEHNFNWVDSLDADSMFGLGNALHAIQDFYSHSNYVEIYLQENPNAKPEDIRSYDEVMNSTDPADAKLKANMQSNLRTGNYPDKKGDPNSHEAINKDTRGRKNFAYARAAAKKHTKNFLRKKKVNNKVKKDE